MRLKPSSDIFAEIPGLYRQIQSVDTASGMEAGEAKLLELLAQKGFTTYFDFMTAALSKELEARAAACTQASDTDESAANPVVALCRRIQEQVRGARELFAVVDQATTSGASTSQHLLGSFRNIRQLPLNLAIASHRFGQEAASISMVAELFDRQREEIRASLEDFSEFVKRTAEETLAPLRFRIACADLQIAMVEAFTQEGGRDDGFETQTLVGMTQSTAEEVLKKALELREAFLSFVSKQANFERLLGSLKSLEQLGLVEAVRRRDIEDEVRPHLVSMKKFYDGAREPARETSFNLEAASKALAHLSGDLLSLKASLSTLEFKLRTTRIAA